jgi:hypothetical protein
MTVYLRKFDRKRGRRQEYLCSGRRANLTVEQQPPHRYLVFGSSNHVKHGCFPAPFGPITQRFLQAGWQTYSINKSLFSNALTTYEVQ